MRDTFLRDINTRQDSRDSYLVLMYLAKNYLAKRYLVLIYLVEIMVPINGMIKFSYNTR